MTVVLEGRIAGQWVSELDRTWRHLRPDLESKKLEVDLRGVTFMDSSGKQLLAEIHLESGNRFRADTPMTKYFAEEIAQGNKINRPVAKKETVQCEDLTALK